MMLLLLEGDRLFHVECQFFHQKPVPTFTPGRCHLIASKVHGAYNIVGAMEYNGKSPGYVQHVTGSGVPSLSQQVYEYLVDRIIRGDIEYGDKLNIKSIAAQLQVSPMPIRDAIKRLEAENIVIIKPRSNCYVKSPTRQMMRELVESRKMIELFAINKIYSYEERSNTPMTIYLVGDKRGYLPYLIEVRKGLLNFKFALR